MNIKIPLPRMPARVTALLGRYSDWAAQPVLRRDWVSATQILVLASAWMWWTDGGWLAFGIAVTAGILCWIWIEAAMWSPRDKL